MDDTLQWFRSDEEHSDHEAQPAQEGDVDYGLSWQGEGEAKVIQTATRLNPLANAAVDSFYSLPAFARSSSTNVQRHEKFTACHDSVPLLYRIIPPPSAPNEHYVDNKNLSIDSSKMLEDLCSLELVSWIAHLVQLNTLADHPVVQSLVLSVYQRGPLYLDPYRIYTFFKSNFSILPLDYVDVWSPLDPKDREIKDIDDGEAWRRRILVRLIRVLRRREGPSPMLHLLFTALCRCLGIRSRLLLAIPPSNVAKGVNKEKLHHFYKAIDPNQSLSESVITQSLKRILVCSPPHYKILQWLDILRIPHDTYSLKRSRSTLKASKRSIARGRDPVLLDPRKGNGIRPSRYDVHIWVEVFSHTQRRWIAIDIETKGFDWTDRDAMVLKPKCKTTQDEGVGYSSEVAKITRLYSSTQEPPRPAASSPRHSFANLLLMPSDSSSNDDQVSPLSGISQDNANNNHCSLPQGDGNSPVCYTFHEDQDVPSPLNEEDRLVQQKSLVFSFAREIKKKAVEEHAKRGRVSLMSCVPISRKRQCPTPSPQPSHDPDHAFSLIFLVANEYSILRDVTLRYCARLWSTVLQKRGTALDQKLNFIVSEWNAFLLQHYATDKEDELGYLKSHAVDVLDTYALQEERKKEMLPKTKAQFRRHSQYVLESLLPLNKVVYPREPIVGVFNGEPVWLRRNVHELLSKRQWEELKHRVVLPGESPVRTRVLKGASLKASLKASASAFYSTCDSPRDEVALYGIWQTQEKKAPCLDNTHVLSTAPIPCSPYGSVNLTNKRLVPLGCVHLKGMPGISFVVREMKTIPWRPALVAFDFHHQVKAVFDGIVIWEYHKDAVVQRYQEYRDVKLRYLFRDHCEKIKKLWTQLLKSLLGRYYMAIEEKQGHQRFTSLKHAQDVISAYNQQQLNSEKENSTKDRPPTNEENKWEDI